MFELSAVGESFSQPDGHLAYPQMPISCVQVYIVLYFLRNLL